jgi:chemotaxis protein histidine kinase CheA
MPQTANQPWVARTGLLVFLALLGTQMGVAPVLAGMAPSGIVASSGATTRGGSDAFLAPWLQPVDAPAETPPQPDSSAEFGRVAALTTILNQQGPRSVENLERVSAAEVLNVTLSPEFVIDARAEREAAEVAAAEAARLAAEAAAAEVTTAEAARSAQAVAEVQAEADAAVAAALAADQSDDAAQAAAFEATREAETTAANATATAEAQAAAAAFEATREAEASAAEATVTAEAQAAARAIQKAEASAAAVAAQAEAQVAAAAASKQELTLRVAVLLLSLALLVGGLLVLRFWRNRKEPFVLKASPVSVTSQAHA